MNHRLVVSSALASVMALGLVSGAASQTMKDDGKGKEKCYGIAKAGQNDCANLSGTHSCAGTTKADHSPDDWKYVAKGTCKAMKGLTAEEAKAKMGSKKS
jgi:uncharacterized membrane protein